MKELITQMSEAQQAGVGYTALAGAIILLVVWTALIMYNPKAKE